jgi:hypothetical protein
MTKGLILIALFIALTSSMAKAGNEKWVQDIRDEISEFEAIKNETLRLRQNNGPTARGLPALAFALHGWQRWDLSAVKNVGYMSYMFLVR